MIREEIVKGYVKDKDVLDVGSVGQKPDYSLWHQIKPYAKSLTGIDIVSSHDKDIVTGNMETYSFSRKFDTVILGDIIEHVDNQGLLLDNVRSCLKDDGVLIITTPNAKWLTVFTPANPSHTLYHDKTTLSNILDRHGFYVSKFIYYCGNKPYYSPLLRPFIIRQQMLAVCKIKLDYKYDE